MNILQEECFSREWLDNQKEQMKRVDPGLLEKSIYALELLGHLATKEIPFVFKGGTCMLLLLENIRRLSIDVDIACTLPGSELNTILNEIGKESRFELFEQDHRDPDRLPRRSHYKFSYTSAVNGKTTDILLDVMEEECLYPQTTTELISTPFAIPERETRVKIPTIEGLTADKLTAFAPNTIGVKYSDRASMKILKHCTDIGVLFDRCESMEQLSSAYEAIWPVENGYRDNAFNKEEVLNDTIAASHLLCLLGLRGCPDNDEAKILAKGIRQLDSHIIGNKFSRDEAKVCAAKAAWLATALKSGNSNTPIPRYNIDELKDLAATPLQGNLAPLNRLKSGTPEAWFYWAKTTQTNNTPSH